MFRTERIFIKVYVNVENAMLFQNRWCIFTCDNNLAKVKLRHVDNFECFKHVYHTKL